MRTARFKNALAGETVVVIGNGPSLNRVPLDLVSSQFATFGSNSIYRFPFSPTYYSFVDEEMLDHLPFPEAFKPKEIFLRAEACVPNNNPIYPIVSAGFSLNINNFIIRGGSATYVLLQIALYMGVKTVLLVGVDHYYPVAGQGKPSYYFKAGKDDPDHFVCGDGKPYFVEGHKYTHPALEAVTEYYKVARSAYESKGSQIINCTEASKLDVFERGNINQWLTRR
jgi:hypothetical protein